MLAHEPKTTTVKEYFKENLDYPPGIGAYQVLKVLIRKSNGDDNE